MNKEQIQQLATLAVDAIAKASDLHQARQQSHVSAIAAMRRIEWALGQLLADTGLSAFIGTPNIGTGSLALRALNVRAKHHDAKLARPPWIGAAAPPLTLILDAKGRLLVAQVIRDQELALSMRPAADADLAVDDLELVANAAIALLSRHRDVAGERTESLAKCALLAQNLDAALCASYSGIRFPSPSTPTGEPS